MVHYQCAVGTSQYIDFLECLMCHGILSLRQHIPRLDVFRLNETQVPNLKQIKSKRFLFVCLGSILALYIELMVGIHCCCTKCY